MMQVAGHEFDQTWKGWLTLGSLNVELSKLYLETWRLMSTLTSTECSLMDIPAYITYLELALNA